MRLGMLIRTMGPQSTRKTLVGCARAAEEAGLDDVFVPDHIAIPPDDAEGSEGRYLDPLATLTYLAALTARIGLGTGVLILPYRPALPTAKAVATLQELSGGRLRLGVGVGWMQAEFRALGVDRRRRGVLTDETLRFLHDCFERDLVSAHGQEFLFRPRPARPRILVGGAAPHALERCVRFGDGWMPMAREPEPLRAPIAELRERAAQADKPTPEVVVLTALPVTDPDRAADLAARFAEVGATGLVHGSRYADVAEFRRAAELLVRIRPAG